MESLFKSRETPVMKPFREIVYEYLRKAIVTGDLAQGHQFKDTELAERFGVSRTPVREALRRLETEGLIKQTPMRGYVVVNLSLQDVAYIFSIRKTLEGLATEYACRHITSEDLAGLKKIIAEGREIFRNDSTTLLDDYIGLTRRFNRKFIEACHVPRLIQLVWNHRELLERFHIIAKILDRCGETLIDDRQALVESLESKEPAAARKIWEDHLDASMRAYFDAVGWPENLDYV